MALSGKRVALGVCLALAACARAAPLPDATVAYLDRLLAGDSAALLAGFAGEPAIDDPMAGPVKSGADLGRFVAERHRWLAERGARLEPLRTTRDAHRTVVEAVLHLQLPDTAIDLPIAVVGDRADGPLVRAIRVYHSHWPLEGAHRVRPRLLPPDSTIELHDVVGSYQRALAAGDVAAIVSTFEPDGYFREPSGGIYVHRGREQLRAFMSTILGGGGIRLEHCTVTDDGVVAAIEFTAVQFGPHRLQPQAGLAVYERGPSGLLHAARIYDDVNVEALSANSSLR